MALNIADLYPMPMREPMLIHKKKEQEKKASFSVRLRTGHIVDEVVHMHFHLDYCPRVWGKNTQSFEHFVLAIQAKKTTQRNWWKWKRTPKTAKNNRKWQTRIPKSPKGVTYVIQWSARKNGVEELKSISFLRTNMMWCCLLWFIAFTSHPSPKSCAYR